MDASYFVRRGEDFEATPLTRGPWSPDLQHAGPACALLARALQRHPDAAGAHVARLSFELLRPLPVGAVFRVAIAPGRTGRKVRGLTATLSEGSRAVVQVSALLVRQAVVPLSPLRQPPAVPPEAAEPWAFPFFKSDIGYHRSMELRRAAGVFGSGRMTVWFRLRCEVVAGEPPSPLERVVAAADSGNGVSVALDLAHYTFVNPDLTIALHRLPRGEWIALESQTQATDAGLGLADTRLWDADGEIGRGLQVLLIERRGSPSAPA